MNTIIKKIKDLIMRNVKVWFDVDGTLIRKDGRLTDLGKWIAKEKQKISVITFGPWNCELLKSKGINAVKVIPVREAISNGMVAICDNGNISKKLNDNEWLVDNEDQPLTKHVIRV